ncbi:MAG: N-6 DNA methylase [Treponema sp.]|nr:N-6 DNA methylase [Treponema sp.]
MPQSVFSPYTSITTNILYFNNEDPSGKIWFYRVDMPKGVKHFSKTKPMKLSDFDDCVAWWSERKEIIDQDNNLKLRRKASEVKCRNR